MDQDKQKRLNGRVAVVTGSSSGIGRAIAIRLAQEGASVVVDYVGPSEGATETLQAVEAAGGKGIIYEADVSNVAAVQGLIEQAWRRSPTSGT